MGRKRAGNESDEWRKKGRKRRERRRGCREARVASGDGVTERGDDDKLLVSCTSCSRGKGWRVEGGEGRKTSLALHLAQQKKQKAQGCDQQSMS
ncbi:hypothetical protein CDL15_Pgr010597 [Punica granatum]|uniref:Uncharacterized protein n=1 Tax=Punica granatum TaxID=22663 RepID=A0A218VRN9_PUNGR|nr:hypothetical protein CDL15_Pgr010597 [Punica granatum]